MTTTVNSADDFATWLQTTASQLEKSDYETILQESLQDLAAEERSLFDSERDSNNLAWTPLAPSTIRRKKNDWILFDTGTLRESLISVGGEKTLSDVSSQEMDFGTSVPYAIFHQEGTRKMPARPPVGMSERILNKLCEQIADQIQRQFAANGDQ